MKPLPKTLLLIILGLIIASNISIDQEVYSNFILLEANHTSYFIKNQSLADQMEVFDVDLYDLSYKIIECESNWNYKAQNKTSSAYGLGQFTNGTWKYVKNKWGIELQRDNYNDQLYAMVRLLDEEGVSHWKTSSWCWNK